MLVRPNTSWLPGVLLISGGAVLAGAVVVLLDTLLVPWAGLVWLAGTVILGGVAVRLRQGKASSCSLGPRLQPLQVSCLGLVGLGVQCYHLAEVPAFVTRFPMLAAPGCQPPASSGASWASASSVSSRIAAMPSFATGCSGA